MPHDGATIGEIVVRGNVVMEGYYNDPEATAARVRGGWFHTGDAAVVHPDGYVEIRDRLQGRDHQRRREHLVGRGRGRAAAPPGRAGGRGRRAAAREVGRGAARVRRAQARRARRPRPSCAQFARERLAHFKAPHGVTFVAELPKTATGKIQKYVLRKGAAAITRQ